MELRSKKQIFAAHIFTYFNFLNLALFGLILLSGQFKNMLFMGVVISNACIGIIQELRVKKIIDSMTVLTATRVTKLKVPLDNFNFTPSNDFKKTLENYQTEIISVSDVKKRDFLVLSAGDQLIADGVIVSSQGLEINESLLTGESIPVKKSPENDAFSGTFVVSGNGILKVHACGEDCYANQLVKKAKMKKRASSEMQNAINRIIRVVSVLIIPIGLGLFATQKYLGGFPVSESIVKTVAGVIGMIPEGLVLLTSVSFIIGVGRLARKNALVQEMEAIEALARVNTLFLDKTGTITTGNLVVERVEIFDQVSKDEIFSVMSGFVKTFPDTNATASALACYFSKHPSCDVVDSIPFSSERKYMGITTADSSYKVGAPEFLSSDQTLIHKAEAYAKEGLRVLLLVGNDTPLSFILLSDEIREDARETFDFFRKQGVEIKVISGDNPMTVSQIATRAGLLGAKNYIDARELPATEEEVIPYLTKYTIFGRISPEQKQLLVKASQKMGNVAGMVGDGVNDVLAIKEADCGIAMAAGSDAAKQSAHIVLLDSDFSSMKDVLSEGRTIIANIERVSALYLTKTVYSMLLCVIFMCLQKAYPFIPIQLSLIGGAFIGVPSFLLTLEKNEAVETHGFLRHVLRICLPFALLMSFLLVVVEALHSNLVLSQIGASTCNLLIGGGISIAVLLCVCRPMNKKRACICALVIGIFTGLFLLLPGLFSVYNLCGIY